MKATRILIRDPELVDLLSRRAAASGMTLTAYIVRFLRLHLGLDL